MEVEPLPSSTAPELWTEGDNTLAVYQQRQIAYAALAI